MLLEINFKTVFEWGTIADEYLAMKKSVFLIQHKKNIFYVYKRNQEVNRSYLVGFLATEE